jgi:hypothetical protein
VEEGLSTQLSPEETHIAMSTSSPSSSATKLGDHLEQFQIKGDQLETLELAATQIDTQKIRFVGVKRSDVRRNIIIPPLLRKLGFSQVITPLSFNNEVVC